MNEVELIKLSKKDAKFLQENFSFAFKNNSIEDIEKTIKNWESSLGFGIAYKQEIVGFIILSEKADGTLCLGEAVREEFKCKGIASKAFELAKEQAKNKGISVIVSSCSAENTASINLHKKLGFNLMETNINKAGNKMHRWEMKI